MAKDTETDQGINNLRYGFSVIIAAFLIPGIFLFYFMISFKLEGLRKDKVELKGMTRLSQEIQTVQKNFFILGSFYGERERISRLGRDTNLHLDPGANSFYMAVLSIYGIPNILDTLTDMRAISPTSPKIEGYVDKLEDELRNTDGWLSYARDADGKMNGYQTNFQEQYYIEKENFFSAIQSIIDTKGASIPDNINGVFQFWNYSNNSLRFMVEQRIALQKKQLWMAISLTSSAWLGSLLFTLWFSSVVAERRRQMLEKIRQQDMTLMMTSKMTALGELAGNIAHEINTPLGAIRLNAELIEQLAQKDPIPAQQVIALSTNLNKTVDKISQIITSMLKYSRSDTEESFIQMDLSKIFEEALLLCQENIAKKSIDLKVQTLPNLLIQCRPNEILQVILNLIKNSIDAVETLPDKWILIEAQRTDGRVTFSITDSGYTKTIRDPIKIFTPFYSTKPIGRGTGLGLGISKRLIESHRGALALDLRSKHTRFVIDLPASPLTSATIHQLEM